MTLTKEQVKLVLDVCGWDGHTLYAGEAFKFLPEEFIKPLLVKHKSDGSPKGTIFRDGKPVKHLFGVYSLDLLRTVADDQEIKYMPAFGRGTEARRISDELKKLVEGGSK